MVDSWTIDVNLKGGTGVTDPQGTGEGVSGGSVPRKTTTGGGVGGFKGLKGVISGALKGLGIASVMGAIILIISGFKSLLNLIGKIFKLISLLLSPIADLLMSILLPILIIIKPIAVAVRKIMSPFTRLAMVMMRQMVENKDPKAGIMAQAALVGGITSVIIVLLNEVMKFVGSMIISGLGGIVGLIFPSVGDKIIEVGVQKFLEAMDTGAAFAIATIGGSIVELGNLLDIDTTDFSQGLGRAMGDVFTSLDREVIESIQSLLADLESDEIGLPAFISKTAFALIDGLMGTGGFTESAIINITSSFDRIADAFNDGISRLRSIAFGEDKGKTGLFKTVGIAADKYFNGVGQYLSPIASNVYGKLSDRYDFRESLYSSKFREG